MQVERHFINPHMTRPQGETLAGQQAQTHPGMAHWAGSGPSDKTCRDCAAWCMLPGQKGSYRRDGEGQLEPRRCRTFVKLMRRGDADVDAGPAVPHGACACRHFELAEVAPLVRARQPINGLTISHDKSGSKYRLFVRHDDTGKTVAFKALLPTITEARAEIIAILSRFDWTGDPNAWTDAKVRGEALKDWCP